ncbi:hypothetical protein RRG08_067372 [Elysia crispata]|uniref:Uncharacterized protein n=1 Tax=Elysia crispata TaxID=231223 RepID=A0AAE1CUT1_9GAST|nr:hypothetical protein RRG08_067372 [Elysia crispata]
MQIYCQNVGPTPPDGAGYRAVSRGILPSRRTAADISARQATCRILRATDTDSNTDLDTGGIDPFSPCPAPMTETKKHPANMTYM